MYIIFKLLPAIALWGIFGFVIFQVPYPNSLTQASAFQLSAFFLPLFFALFFSINLFLNFFIHSILISGFLILLLTLQALQILNLITLILTVASAILLITYFKKAKNLTIASRIPKLRLSNSKIKNKMKSLRKRRR